MVKELVISIVIIICIVSLDMVTQDYTKECIDHTSVLLHDLKKNIDSEEENITDNLEKLLQNWKEKKEKLSYFIEHDELEKVETNLVNLQSYINEEDFSMAITSIDEAEFILEHIKEKNALNLKNIF